MPIASSLLERKAAKRGDGRGPSVATVSPDKTVLEAAKLMNEHRIGATPVLGPDGRIVGMFTERDILTKVVARELAPGEVLVRDVMSSPVIAAGPDATLDELRHVMTTQRIRHIPVVEDGRLLGIISIGDLNVAQVEVMTETITYLEQYMYGPNG
jgi:CBS domain-containing protein